MRNRRNRVAVTVKLHSVMSFHLKDQNNVPANETCVLDDGDGGGRDGGGRDGGGRDGGGRDGGGAGSSRSYSSGGALVALVACLQLL